MLKLGSRIGKASINKNAAFDRTSEFLACYNEGKIISVSIDLKAYPTKQNKTSPKTSVICN